MKEPSDINEFIAEDELFHEISFTLRDRRCSHCDSIVDKIYSLETPPYYCKKCKKYVSSKEVNI